MSAKGKKHRVSAKRRKREVKGINRSATKSNKKNHSKYFKARRPPKPGSFKSKAKKHTHLFLLSCQSCGATGSFPGNQSETMEVLRRRQCPKCGGNNVSLQMEPIEKPKTKGGNDETDTKTDRSNSEDRKTQSGSEESKESQAGEPSEEMKGGNEKV